MPMSARPLLSLPIAVLALPAVQALEFGGIGDLPGGAFRSTVDCVSSNGLYLGGQGTSASGLEGFRWSEAGGFLAHGDPPNSPYNSATHGISNNGQVAAGRVTIGVANSRAGRWVPSFQYYALPPFNSTGFRYGSANAVSDDGLRLVGQTSAQIGSTIVGRAFFWRSNTGGTVGTMLNLGVLQGSTSSFSNAQDISGNGLVVVGSSTLTITEPAEDPEDPPTVVDTLTEAFRWTASGGMVGLGDFDEDEMYSEALATTTDGSIIVGVASLDDPTPEDDEEEEVDEGGPVGFVWRDGTMQAVGDLHGGTFDSRLRGISDDGQMAVGTGTDASGATAVIWDPANGLRKLSDLLSAAGVDLSGWTLTGAADISADGEVIVGNAINPDGLQEGWRITGARELLMPSLGELDLEVEVGTIVFFDTAAGDRYQVEYSDNATDWHPLGEVHDTVGMAQPTPHHLVDPAGPVAGRDYRVVLQAGSLSTTPPPAELGEGSVLRFRSVPGQPWQVEFSPDLGVWSALEPTISSVDDSAAFTRTIAHFTPPAPEPPRTVALYRLVVGESP